jgi:hypothetical protein
LYLVDAIVDPFLKNLTHLSKHIVADVFVNVDHVSGNAVIVQVASNVVFLLLVLSVPVKVADQKQ